MSWAEVDKIRDKSKSRDRDPMQKQSSPAAMNAQKSYRAALERAFASGKLGELAKSLGGAEESRMPMPGPLAHAAAPAQPAAALAVSQEPAGEASAQLAAPTAAAIQRDPEREQKQKLLSKIREAEGREAITKAVDAFVTKYSKLPDDFEILTQALGHRSDERVRTSLDQLTTLVEKDKPRRARTLAGQLRMLEDTHGDPEIRAHAARVRARL